MLQNLLVPEPAFERALNSDTTYMIPKSVHDECEWINNLLDWRSIPLTLVCWLSVAIVCTLIRKQYDDSSHKVVERKDVLLAKIPDVETATCKHLDRHTEKSCAKVSPNDSASDSSNKGLKSRWADVTDDPDLEYPRSRPQFARANRDQRIQQLLRTIQEFCNLEFHAVDPSEQMALTLRMLVILKSLSSIETFWTEDGVKHREVRHVLLGIGDHVMRFLASAAARAEHLCNERCFQDAYATLCHVRPLLQRCFKSQGTNQSLPENEGSRRTCPSGEDANKVNRQAASSQCIPDQTSELKGTHVLQAAPGSFCRLPVLLGELGLHSAVTGTCTPQPRRQPESQHADGVNPLSSNRQAASSLAPEFNAPSVQQSGPVLLQQNKQSRGALSKEKPSQHRSKKMQGQFLIGMEEDSDFHICRRVLGPHGSHMKHIARQSGARLRLRGRGSGFLEGPNKQESTDPLMLCISAPTPAGYDKAVRLTQQLFTDIQKEYQNSCARQGHPLPDLQIQFHRGARKQ